MPEIKILNEVEVKDIVIKEIRSRDKLISKGQIIALIKIEVTKQNKDIYKKMDKLRKLIIDERRLK